MKDTIIFTKKNLEDIILNKFSSGCDLPDYYNVSGEDLFDLVLQKLSKQKIKFKDVNINLDNLPETFTIHIGKNKISEFKDEICI